MIKFRYELLDKENRYKSVLDNVLSASISYDSEADIKRTARFEVKEEGNIDYLSDRIKPYVCVKIPGKEYVTHAEYDTLDGPNVWRRSELQNTTASQYLQLASSPNLCPNFNEWELGGDATLEGDTLCLWDYGASATSPIIPVDGEFWFSADYFRPNNKDAPQPWQMPFPYFIRLVKVEYMDENMRSIGTVKPFNLLRFNGLSVAYSNEPVYHDNTKAIPLPIFKHNGFNCMPFSRRTINDVWHRDILKGRKASYIRLIITTDPNWTPPSYWVQRPMVTNTGETNYIPYNGYAKHGTTTVTLRDVSIVEAVSNSLIEWEQSMPHGTGIMVETNIFTDSGWQGWHKCHNGDNIPVLYKGINLSDSQVKYRITMKGTGLNTPTISWLRVFYNGYARTKTPDKWDEYPLGVFLLSTPSKHIDDGIITRNIEAYDQLQILKEDSVTGNFLIATGTLFIDAVKSILDSAGIKHYNITYTDLQFPVDREWEGGTSKLEIINEILEAMNYQSLWFDENGYAIVHPYERADIRTATHIYRDDENSILLPAIEETYDLFSVPNRFILVVSEPDMPEMKSIYTNDNPDSPTSTINRGRVITNYIKADAPDQETLDALAERAAYKASQVYQTIDLDTRLMPTHSHNDIILLETNGQEFKYEEIAWNIDLQIGSTMKHTLRRIVPV